jgi:hypothetical protein
LFSISGITLYSANTGILEQKVSANDYRARQLSDAADAGIDYAMAWLVTNTPTWIADPDDASYQIASNDLSLNTANGFAATLQLRRADATPERVTLTATATQTGGGSAPTAISRITILQNKLVKAEPETPLMINGSLSGVTGAPTIRNDETNNIDVVSSGSAASVDQGNFTPDDGTFDVQGDAFSGTAWDRVFGVSQSQMQALAGVSGSGVYWITQSTPYSTNLGNLSPVQSVIAVFTNCATINGGTQIVGIVYYAGSCSSNGWGGADIYGAVIVDGDVTQLNANTHLEYDTDYVSSFLDQTVGIKSRVPGTWIDQ